MRKLILFIATSLDGYIARENEGVDWLFSDGDFGFKKFYASVDTVVMGRKTYQIGLKLGEKFDSKRNIIFSKKKREKLIGTSEYADDPVKTVKGLLKEDGKDIWLGGGGQIASILLNAGLVNELILFIHPIILGNGFSLYRNIGKDIKLHLDIAKKFDNGLLQLNYTVLNMAVA